MPDYPGAVAAIRERFATAWAGRTPIARSNARFDPPDRAPWVFVDIVAGGAKIVGAGTPGSRTCVQDGLIKIYGFVPVDTEDAAALQLASDAGDALQLAKFYDATPGFYLRTGLKRVDDDESPEIEGVHRGKWFAITATVPFEFWFRA